MDRCRFAPTTSGPAHPGTLLAALLAWLDARSRGAPFALRLEDIDPERCPPEAAPEMREALRWLGLDWDAESLQSQGRPAHEAALDRLAASGDLYPCRCSRREVRAAGSRAADGGWRYPGTCRGRALPEGGWRSCRETLRLRLAPGRIEPREESALDVSQDPERAMGDPVLRRADGALAYHLAAVVDDANAGVTRVVRGRDLAASTALQVALQGRLGLASPRYRHHLLLLEEREGSAGPKLAKLHGAVGWRELAAHAPPEHWCGLLGHVAGLAETPEPIAPGGLLSRFAWERVGDRDVAVRWTGSELVSAGAAPAGSATTRPRS